MFACPHHTTSLFACQQYFEKMFTLGQVRAILASEVLFMEFRDRLQHLRIKKGWTQEELASKANVSRESIVNYENGRRKNPPSDIAGRLADKLDVSVNQLLYGKEATKMTIDVGHGPEIFWNEPPGHLRHMYSSDELKEMLLKSFDILNIRGQKEAVKRVDELTEVARYCDSTTPSIDGDE